MDFASPRALQSKSDCAKTLTLALALLMSRSGELVGLLGDTKRGRSSAAIDHMGERLSTPESNPNGFENLANQPFARHTFITQISDFLEPLHEIEAVFQALSSRTNNALIIQTLDPDELDLPHQGRTLFEDPRTHNQELISNVCDIREAYRVRIEEHQEGLKSLCRLSGWHYIFHNTQTPLEDTLFKIQALMSPEGMP